MSFQQLKVVLEKDKSESGELSAGMLRKSLRSRSVQEKVMIGHHELFSFTTVPAVTGLEIHAAFRKICRISASAGIPALLYSLFFPIHFIGIP